MIKMLNILEKVSLFDPLTLAFYTIKILLSSKQTNALIFCAKCLEITGFFSVKKPPKTVDFLGGKW